MKLLLYAAVFCFLISLVTAGEEEDGGEEEAAPNGNETETAPRGPKVDGQKGGEGEEEEEEQAGGSATPTTGKTTTAPAPTAPPTKPPSGGGSTPEEQGTGVESKGPKKGGKRGPRRCRLSPTKSNCIGKGNFKLWYYNASSQLCERHKVGGCPKLIGGFVFCTECTNWCNKRINAKKACLGVK
ncbi:neurofilament heavy polypeptide [Rhipicephalus sanguineus]|uniref:neurofilament heavy polypeptide n=1 Tax=Rhipicephalus sanguineus TaxID=34632 RepID=UPI001893BA78|nr:neurofilament heavy polypeptide [Rhipicephalus sanguineus]